jgi:hypothetical protein
MSKTIKLKKLLNRKLQTKISSDYEEGLLWIFWKHKRIRMQKEGNGARITITLKGWYFKDGSGFILLENSVKTIEIVVNIERECWQFLCDKMFGRHQLISNPR